LFGLAAKLERAAVATGGGGEAGEFFGREARCGRGAFAAVDGGEDAAFAPREIGVSGGVEGCVEGEGGGQRRAFGGGESGRTR